MGLLRRGCSGLILSVIFSVIFVAIGAIFTVVFGQVVTLDCVRPEPAEIICERRSTFLGIRLSEPQTIRDVQGAWVQENCDEGCTYRVMLTAGRSDVPLTRAYTSDERTKVETAAQINALATGGAPTAQIILRPNPLVLLATLIFVIIGLAIPVLSLFGR
jgi:hypothetical protein